MVGQKGSSLVALLVVFVVMFIVIVAMMRTEGSGLEIATDRNEEGEVVIIEQANDVADLLNNRNKETEVEINN